MTHKLEILGAALIVVLALTASMTPAASAANYTASKYPTTMTATSAKGNDVFTTEAGTWKCAVHYEATVTEPSSNLTVKTSYTGCESFGFLNATVSMGSCDWLYTEPIKVSGHDWKASADTQCSSAEPMRIVSSTCEITIAAQSPGGHLAITNTTSPGDLDTRTTLTEIIYTVTKDGFLCAFNGTGAKIGGTYSQSEAITFGSTNGAGIDVG